MKRRTLRRMPVVATRVERFDGFSDEAPYKTNVAADLAIRALGEDETEHGIPGLYFSWGLEGEYLGIGAWHMSPSVLARYRGVLDHPQRGAEIQRLVDQLLTQGCTIEAMDKLKRVPPPYAQDHPRAELLKHKGLAIVAQAADGISSSPKVLDWAEEQLRMAAP